MIQLPCILLCNLPLFYNTPADIVVAVIIPGDFQHFLYHGADAYDGIREHFIIFLQRLSQVPVDIAVEHGLKGFRVAESLGCIGTPYAEMYIPYVLPFLFPDGKVQDVFIQGIQLCIEQKLVQIVKIPVHTGG